MNHIRTPNRFELVLDDPVIIGMRQAALQMGAKAFEKVKDADANEVPCKSPAFLGEGKHQLVGKKGFSG